MGNSKFGICPVWRVTAKPPAEERPFTPSETIPLTQPSQKIIVEETSGNRQSIVSWARPWYRGATINTDTGVLSINLIHLLRLTENPLFVKALGPLKIFEVHPRTLCSLFMVIDKFDLKEHIRPGLDHVFILDVGDSSCIYLILRESGCPHSFKLIRSLHSLFMFRSGKIEELYLTDLSREH
jgi:hypothetical protein